MITNHPLGQMVNNRKRIHFVVWQDTEVRNTPVRNATFERRNTDNTEDASTLSVTNGSHVSFITEGTHSRLQRESELL